MTSSPKPNQSAAILSSRRQPGDRPWYQWTKGSFQAIGISLSRRPCGGKPMVTEAILATT